MTTIEACCGYRIAVGHTMLLDDGLLLIVARDDRKARIEVGYGLEGVVTDALASRIIRWRKAWAKNWEQVLYCSDACRKHKTATPP